MTKLKEITAISQALKTANQILNNDESSDKDKKEAYIQLAKKLIVETLDTINEKDSKELEYSDLLFNNIYDTWNTAKKYQSRDPKFFKIVKTRLAGQQTTDTSQKSPITQSLEKRIRSPYTASLRKGDYLKFYLEIHDEVDRNTAIIKTEVEKLVAKAKTGFRDLSSPKEPDLDPEAKREFAVTVIDQLRQYDLLSHQQIDELLGNQTLFPPGTKSLFTQDSKLRLEFTRDPNSIPQVVAKAKGKYKTRALRLGSETYFKQAFRPQTQKQKAKQA